MDEKFLRRLPLIIFGFIVLLPLLRKGGGFLFFIILIVVSFIIFKKGKFNLNNFNILNKLNNKNKHMSEAIFRRIKEKR